jgi:hypothetical protein
MVVMLTAQYNLPDMPKRPAISFRLRYMLSKPSPVAQLAQVFQPIGQLPSRQHVQVIQQRQRLAHKSRVAQVGAQGKVESA